jgi:hypothetical protein
VFYCPFCLIVRYVFSLLLCSVIVQYVILLSCMFVLYLSCVSFLFCMVAFFLFLVIVSYVLFFPLYFLYLYTNHCHQVETQSQ